MTARSYSRPWSAVRAVTVDSVLDLGPHLDRSDENGHGDGHDEDREQR